MSTDIADKDKPTAVWFRMARASQSWTVGDLVERMQAEIDWAPSRPNYSTYEQGHTVPKPETMAKFYDFWARYGIDPPDLNPPTTAPPEGDTLKGGADLIDALTAQTKAINALADQVKALVEAQSPAATAALTAKLVALAIGETLPGVLLAAGLRPK